MPSAAKRQENVRESSGNFTLSVESGHPVKCVDIVTSAVAISCTRS